jgi:hypothetical protein
VRLRDHRLGLLESLLRLADSFGVAQRLVDVEGLLRLGRGLGAGLELLGVAQCPVGGQEVGIGLREHDVAFGGQFGLELLDLALGLEVQLDELVGQGARVTLRLLFEHILKYLLDFGLGGAARRGGLSLHGRSDCFFVGHRDLGGGEMKKAASMRPVKIK